MPGFPDIDELPTKAADWLIGKSVSAAEGGASRLFDMALGLYLSALGLGAAESAQDAQMKQVQASLTAIKNEVEGIRTRLAHLEAETRLGHATLLERFDKQLLAQPRVVIEDAYDDLLANVARGDAGETVWTDVMARQWYQGTEGLQHQLHLVHEAVAGTELTSNGGDGMLASYTAVLVELLRQKSGEAGALSTAYQALECRFADVLSLQAKALFLMTIALNWRDRCAAEQRAGTRPRDPAALVSNFSGSAGEYLALDFKPRLQKQVDIFLRCVDRLVLTGFFPRTHIVAPYKETPRASTAEFTTAQTSLLDRDAAVVYARADRLAAGVCPDVHGHIVVVRLVGDPRQVEQELRAARSGANAPRVMAYGPSPWLKPDGSPVSVPLAETVAMEVVPIGGQPLALYGPPDVALPEASFPSGEYIEWWNEGDVVCARPQTQVAVLKLGVRELWVPEHPDFKATTLPVCRAGVVATNFRVRCCDNSFEPLGRIERVETLAAGAADGGGRHFGHYLVPVRGEPWLGRWTFSTYRPEDRPELARWELPQLQAEIFTHWGRDADVGRREMCRVSLRDGGGRRLVARYALASQGVYEVSAGVNLGPFGKGVRISQSLDKSFHFRFAVGTQSARAGTAWLAMAWRDFTTSPPPMTTLSTPGWASISTAADHPKDGTPTALYLFQENDTPDFHGGALGPDHKVLTSVLYWIDDIEIALART